jgi:serine/threonine-protein kinase HipA
MGRRKAHVPLAVLINNRHVGRLSREPSGATAFQYDRTWLEWEHAFAISLSLPLREAAYSGAPVIAVFDNLLPDNDAVRRIVAERTGADGTDAYSLLACIGRDCVGAMQFLPDDAPVETDHQIRGEPVSDQDIEAILANLSRAPLGIDPEHGFRISVAGAQEKTALLRHDGQWYRPVGTTPTTHLLKPQLGTIPTAFGSIDMAASVDNEHYCLKLLETFGLPVAATEIATFGARRVLVVERFDRHWRTASELLRLPQEDCCQALGVPPGRKYQNNGGPSIADILRLLQAANEPLADQAAFLTSQILFWLIGATDGHGKNFSLFLRPGGRFALTPFYDVLSAQPAFDLGQIPLMHYKLAMSAGTSRHYRLDEIVGRHFVQTGKAAGLGPTVMRQAIESILACAAQAPDAALAVMPADFAVAIHESVSGAIAKRIGSLEAMFAEL